MAAKEGLDVLAFLLQQKDFVVDVLLILLHIATLDTTHYQRTVSLLLSPPPSNKLAREDEDNNNNTSPVDDIRNDNNNNSETKTHNSQKDIKQLTTTQRLAIFTTTHRYSDLLKYTQASQAVFRGTKLTDEEYFQHCKELIQSGEIRVFGILRILDLINPPTVDLLLQSMPRVDPSIKEIGEPCKYILHINSQQWRGIDIDRKQIRKRLQSDESSYRQTFIVGGNISFGLRRRECQQQQLMRYLQRNI